MANKDDVGFASHMACGDMLKELGHLARRAEKAGVQPRSEMESP